MILPSPRPPSNLSIPSPPRSPLTKPPRPSPFRSLPTRPSTPARRRPTAAMIWNRGSVRRPQSGLRPFLACGMSAIFFFALSMVLTTVVVSSLSESANAYSSGVASRFAARALALAAIRPSGSRPRMAPLHSCSMRPPSSIRGLTS